MRWLLLLLIVPLSGCIEPELDDLVAQPRDMPEGYEYWPIELAEFYRIITNATTNPGTADAAIAESPNAVRAYSSAFYREGPEDDIIITIAFEFGSESQADAWFDAETCSNAGIIQNGAFVTVMIGFDDAAQPTIPIVAQNIAKRTGGTNPCHDVKPWL